MIIDQYGMIQSGGDGGDSCHRMYTFYLRLRLQAYPLKIVDKVPASFNGVAGPEIGQTLLEPNKDGVYIRNPDPAKWYSDPRNFSRDQMTPVICFHTAMASSPTRSLASDGRKVQTRLLKACIKRYMFAQNIYPNWVDPRVEQAKKKTPDFLNFDLWGVFARAYVKTLWAPLALPVVLFGDASLVLGAFLKCFAPISADGTLKFRMPGPDDVDDDNMNNVLMTTQYVFPTPLSWLARKIYKKFRRQNYGNTKLGEKSAVMGAIAWYNRDGNQEMTELARPLVERY